MQGEYQRKRGAEWRGNMLQSSLTAISKVLKSRNCAASPITRFDAAMIMP